MLKFSVRTRYHSNFAEYQARVAKKQQTVLFRLGGYVRTVMRRSMKSKPKRAPKRGKRPKVTSVPGQPPLAKRGDGGLRWLGFSVDMGAGP